MKKKIIAFLLFNITFLFGSNVVFAATNSTIIRKNPYQKVNYKNTWTATDQGDWEANAYYTDNKSSSHITGSKGSNAYCIFPSGKSGVGNGKSITATEVTNNSSFHKIVKLLYYGYGGPKWNKSGDTLSQRIKGYYDAVCSAYRTDASGRHYAFENGVCDDDDYYFITHIALSYFASKLPDSSYRVPDETDVFYILNWVTEDQIKSSSLTQDPYNTITISDSDFHVWYYEQGSGYQNFVYWTYGDEPELGHIEIKKAFSGTTDGYADFSNYFYEYEVQDLSGNNIGWIRTNSSGIAKYPSNGADTLEYGTKYKIIERVDSNGYAYACSDGSCYATEYKPTPASKEITVGSSSSTASNNTFTNKKEVKYCASVTKTGANGLTFGSATFNVYSNSSCSGNPTGTITLSSSEPTYLWDDLSSNNSISIKEISAPTGFRLDNSCHEIEAKSSCSPQNITNSPYYLTFAKTDENGNAMANASFQVKNSSGTVIKVDAKSNQYNGCYVYNPSGALSTMDTDSTGRICIIKIPSGTYSAVETATGNSNYPLPSSVSDRTLTPITTSTSVDTFANAIKFKNKPYLINFYKVDEENNPKGGATFNIKNSSGQYITHSGTSTATGYRGCYIYSGISTTTSTSTNFVSASTSSNLDVNVGEVCVIKVPSGTYSAVETSISDGAYYVPENKTITGINANTSKTGFASAGKLKNYPYYLTFYKKDEDGNFMQGAQFKLRVGTASSNTYVTTSGTDSNGCYIYSSNDSTGSTFTTDSNGRVCISRVLAPVNYYTYEVSTGNTSYAVVTTSKTITRNKSIEDSKSDNTVVNKPYLINFYKVNEEDSSMAGATFKIKTSSNKYLKYKKSNGNPVYSPTSGYVGCYIYDGEDNDGDIFTTSSNSNNNGVSIGEICVIRVKNGSYSAIEQSTGSNQYYLNPNNKTIDRIDATTTLTRKEDAEKLVNYPFIIQMWKSKEDKSAYLSEASFKVYYLDGTTKHYLNHNGVSDVTGYKGCYKYSGETTTENNGSSFITSNAATGNISADEVCIIGIPSVSGRKYYAYEYQSNDVKYSTQEKSLGSDNAFEMVGPNSTKQIKSDKYTFINTPYLINFFKTDENGNNGANDPSFSSSFKVYDNNNKYVIVETNNNNEPIKSNVAAYKGCYIYKSSTTNSSSASVLTSSTSESSPIRKGEICIIRIPQKNNYEDNNTLSYTAIEFETNNSAYFVPTDNNRNRISGLNPNTPFSDKIADNSLKNRPYLLNFFKENEEDNSPLNGAEFSIKDSNGTDIGYSGTESYTDSENNTKTCYIYSTASNANKIFKSGEYAPPGEVCLVRVPKTSGGEELTYTITEKYSAEYHTFGSYKTITLSPTEKYQPKYLSAQKLNVFINYPTAFEFTKSVSSGDAAALGVDWNNITTKELQKLSFNIYDSNGSILSFIETSTGVYEYAGNDLDGITGTTVTDLKLDNNRKFKVYHLKKGTYSVKEKKVCCDSSCGSCTGGTECSGFYYPSYTQESDYKFEITECSSSYATSCSQHSISTKSLNNTPTEITFTKNDFYNYIDATKPVKFENEDEINAFDNIKFRLKDENGNYVKLIKVGNTGSCNNTSSYAEYRYVADTRILSDEESAKLVTDIYTCGGNIKINHLCRGKKYTIEEYYVPSNTVFINSYPHITKDYLLPFTEDGKNCCDDNTVETVTTQTISDVPTRIALFKKNNRTSTDIHEADSRKETATFEVYACTNLNAKCTKETSTREKVKFQNARTYGSERVYPFRLDQSTIDSETVTTLFLTTEGNKGKLVLEYLPANYKYVVVETNGPDGYYNLEGELAETEIEYVPKDTNNSSDNNKNIINYPTMILFRKSDIYKYYNSSDSATLNSNNKIFDTMTFVLRDKDGNVVSLSKTTDGEYRFIQDDGTITGNSETNLHTKNGSLLITNLYRNEKYYIEETATDTLGNFILPTNVQKPSGIPSGWTWRGHPFVSYDINSMLPSDTESGTVPSESVTSLIENKPTRVVFEKRDKTTGELIDDTLNNDEDTTYSNTRTTFNVYRCPKTIEHCRATSEGAELVYFEEREFVSDENDNDITNDISSVTPPVLTYKYSKLNNSTNAVSDLITDRGVLVLAYLPSEYSYSLYEKTAPNGYYQPTGAEAYTEFIVLSETAPDGSDYVELTERIENTPTEIYFEKSDLYNYYEEDDLASLKDDSLKIFDSISFVLKDKNGRVLELKCSSDGEFVSNKNTNDKCDTGEYRYIPVDNNNKIDTIHTKNGKLKITHLYRGEIYYIEEIGNDTEGNFILPDYMNRDMNYGDALPFDNQGHPVVKYILPQNEPSDKSTVTAEIKNTPSRVAFQKKDSKYGYLIPDETTTFKVYQCLSNIECHPSDYSTDEERNANGIILMNFTQRGKITGDNEDRDKEVYKYKKLNESGETELHPFEGELILRYLPSDSNYKYVLLEIVSPKNYTLPSGIDAETEFTISQSKVEVEEIDVPNKPTSLLLKKYSDDGELLEGAEFEIYEGTTCDPNLSPMAQPKELLSFKTITDGIYEYRRNFDTSRIRTCTDTVDGKCNGMTSTLTLEDYEDTWTYFPKSTNQIGEPIETINAGEALIQYLEYGHCYIIKEVKAPKGYSLPEKEEDRYIMVTIEKENDVVDTYKELINKPTPYTFYKFDEHNELIDGAEFKLQKLNSDKIYEDVTVSLYETEVDRPNKGIYYKVDSETDNTLITTVNGAATIFFLEEGQYRIVETKAPEGKELPAKQLNVATFIVDKDGRVTGSSIITNKPKTEKIEVKPKAEAELIVNISTGQQVIRYGLIIGIIVISIFGLIMVQNKSKKDE